VFSAFQSCAADIPEDATDYLNPPVITGVTQNGEHIYVTFTGYNNEYYFQGYNVYVYDTKMLSASVSSYTHAQVDMPGYASATPSYPLYPTGPQSGTLKLNQDSNTNSFQNATYWIMMGSYHQYLKVKEEAVSNQVSINFIK
jgi:hypothetical protein